MTFSEFMKKYIGHSIDFDHVAGVQCVDLVKLYLNEVCNIPKNKLVNMGNAEAYWNNFNNIEAFQDFEKIKNSPNFVPKQGDIMVWNKRRGNGAGHVAICTGKGTTSYFYSLDLNWNNHKYVEEVKHDYKNIYGVLRKKSGQKLEYKKGDLIYVPVKFTKAKNEVNSLVEFENKQFWIANEEFIEFQSVIIGTVCFIEKNSYGLAFHYFEGGTKKEFQMNILKEKCR